MLPEGKCRYIDGQIYPDGNFYVLDTEHIKHNGNELKSALNSISTDVSNKVDKVSGKGLSTEDYTTAEKNKLSGMADNANNYVHPTTSGNKHIPSGGSSGKILGWSADGEAAWVDPSGGGGGGSVETVFIDSTEYAPDANGKVTLPAYPTSLPASDVYSWAKAATKPSYTASEVGAASDSHTHGSITNDGKLSSDVTIASGDKLVITDSSDSSKIARTSISFDGSTTTQALTKKGTWGTFLTSHQSLSGYVPTSRTINGYDLSANRSLTYSDVGAASSGHTHSSASTSSAGFMSSTDKSRLNGLYDSMANMRSLKSNPVFDLKHIQVILANQTWTASDGGMYYCTPINSGLSHIFSISLGGYGALKSSLVIIPSRSVNNTQTFTLLSNTNSFSQWANVYVLIFGLA